MWFVAVLQFGWGQAGFCHDQNRLWLHVSYRLILS